MTMKVLGVAEVPLGRNDGASVHVTGLYAAFQEEGAETLCLVPSISQAEQSLPFRVAYVPVGEKAAAWTVLWHLLSPLWMFYYRLRLRPDILYLRGHLLILHCLIARLTRLPVAVEVNDEKAGELEWESGVRRRAAGLMRLIDRGTYRLASQILSVTPQLTELVISDYGADPRKCRTVSNGFDREMFFPQERQVAKLDLKLDPGRRYVIFIARLTPRHSFGLMLRGFALLAQAVDDVDLLIVGDGPAREEIVELSESFGVRDRMLFTGQVSGETAANMIAASEFGIAQLQADRNARRVGASPIKVWAYLGCARPIISGKVPNLTEIISAGRCGLILPEDSPEAFAESASWLLSHDVEAVAMGRRGYEMAVAEHTWNAVARRTLAHLSELACDS